MSRPPNHHHHHHDHPNYRQALSYNDQGIDFMRRRDYGEAIGTFQMALTIMRQAISDDGNEQQMSTMLMPQQHMSTTTKVVIRSDQVEEIMIMSSDTQMMIISNAESAPGGGFGCCDGDNCLWPISIDPPMAIDRELLLRNVSDNDENERGDKWEWTIVIIMYNIGLCKMKITTTATSSSASSLSGKPASRLFGLAWQLIRGMVQRVVDHPRQEDTIPAWYGLHQIEMMILSAIMCHHPHQPNMMMTPTPPWWLQQRKQQVQRVLKSHRDMITFLFMFTTNHPTIAPCA